MGVRGSRFAPRAILTSGFCITLLVLVACSEPPVETPSRPDHEDGKALESSAATGTSNEDSSIEAGRESAHQQAATPTMSPLVQRMATGCSGWRIGSEIEPGRLVSAVHADGIWNVEVEGVWEFHGVINATPVGYPTHAAWKGAERVIRCTREIDAITGQVGEQSSVVVTTTPSAP